MNFNEISNHPFLKNTDRYQTKSGIKVYTQQSSLFEDNRSDQTGINFVALLREESLENFKEFRFKFMATMEFFVNNRLQGGESQSFIELYGTYEFRKWLNEIDFVEPQTTVFSVTSENYSNVEVIENKLVAPIDFEDQERLNNIAEEGILKIYSTNYNEDELSESILIEKIFVPQKNFDYVYNNLINNQYINLKNNNLTKEGSAYYKNLSQNLSLNSNSISSVNSSSKTIFVAHCFNDEMLTFYRDIIRPVVEEFKLAAISISDEDPDDTLDASILSQIVQSRFIIADITYSRPSVYFEAGYAHGRGIRVIYTCKEDHNSDSDNFISKKNKVHFDIRNRRISWWSIENLETFKLELRERIKQLLQKN